MRIATQWVSWCHQIKLPMKWCKPWISMLIYRKKKMKSRTAWRKIWRRRRSNRVMRSLSILCHRVQWKPWTKGSVDLRLPMPHENRAWSQSASSPTSRTKWKTQSWLLKSFRRDSRPTKRMEMRWVSSLTPSPSLACSWAWRLPCRTTWACQLWLMKKRRRCELWKSRIREAFYNIFYARIL